ncbi:MAG TPA: hypothetical protein VKH19_00220 [Gemmatimonadaceae bacterium]|nr:hypothetical protein [Gemmatimonadaceae bacterium]
MPLPLVPPPMPPVFPPPELPLPLSRMRSTMEPPKSRNVSTPAVTAVAACCTTSCVTRFTRATGDEPPRLAEPRLRELERFLDVPPFFALPFFALLRRLVEERRFAPPRLRIEALLPRFPFFAELRRDAPPFFFFAREDFFRADDFFLVAI